METVVTVIVLLAMIALGVLLIHRLNAQHNERIASFPYGRPRTTTKPPTPPPPPQPPTHTNPTNPHTRQPHRTVARSHSSPRHRP